MTWQYFEPMDLFGEGLGAPVWVRRGEFREYKTDELAAECGLEQLTAVMGGRAIPVPRLEAWYGDRPYRFGGREVKPQPAPPEVVELGGAVEGLTGERFSACFVNYYRDGSDWIPWHADDDHWIGPVIASISFGATRRFCLRRKNDHRAKVEGYLAHGDVLLMKAGCQREWEHSVPRSKTTEPRLSLTFRQVAK